MKLRISALMIALFAFSWLGMRLADSKIKGTFFPDSQLHQNDEGIPHCAIDSGAGMVMELTQLYRNDLFLSEEKNTLRLRIHFATPPVAGQKYSLPTPGVTVCYREEGKLLMFESYNGLGTLQFNSISDKKIAGKIDLKLVKPHHNMSNSDYHYMGGEFSCKP
ncbi:MAG: hypothetical protein H6581_14390 [Bacteroidia bacterium]|nr:hypothetical protein [Bacteroidia bacterium]